MTAQLTTKSLHILKRRADRLEAYAVRISIILSLTLSLAVVAITLKNHLTGHVWVNLAAFTVPIVLLSYFRNRIVLFGPVVYVAALILILGAALFFGT